MDTATVPINDDLFERLFSTAMSCITNDKVRSNGVRALGNLLRLIRASHLQTDRWRSVCMAAIQHLHHQCTATGNMKVKWNACYAMGNMMRNPVMFSMELKNFDWQSSVVPTLCRICVEFPNFKVRINAAAALAVLDRRDCLTAEHFVNIWHSLLDALERSDHIVDFNEYMHRDNLVDQLCISVAHYMCLATISDWIGMSNAIQSFDSIHSKWQRVINRIVPEKATVLLAACAKMKAAQKSDELRSAEQRLALQNICACFALPVDNTL